MKKRKLILIFILFIFITACSDKKKDEFNDANSDNMNSFDNNSQTSDKNLLSNGKNIILKNGLKDESLIVIGEDEEGYGELGINIKGEDNLVLLCKDPVYDIVYYVNYGNDFFIYRIKDGESELVVEMPARRLFCQKGKLYFLLDSYNRYDFKGIESGNILSYDPISGEVNMLIDRRAQTMFVYSDGIYFKVNEDPVEISEDSFTIKNNLFCYSFVSAKVEEIEADYISLYKWKDFHFTSEVDVYEEGHEIYEEYDDVDEIFYTVGLKLETLDKSKSIYLTDNWMLDNYSLVGDKIIDILEDYTFVAFDIVSKEKKEIPLALRGNGDFTILDDILYLDNFLLVDIKTGKQSKAVSKEETGELIYEIYTDGKKIYGICGEIGGIGSGQIKQIIFEKNTDVLNIYRDQEENGVTYSVGEFAYYTLPIGEEQ